MIKLTSEDKHFLRVVIAPSWLSSLVIVLVGLIVAGGAVVTFSLNHSVFKQDLVGWEQSHASKTLSITGQSTQIVNPNFANSWPLILVWAVVGLAIYVIAASIIRGIIGTIEFEQELNYIHANPHSMLKNIIEHLVMRLIAAFLLVTLVVVFVYHTLPYIISVSRHSATHPWSLNGIHYAVVSFVLTVLCAYAGSILLRLALGRERVFSH